jgi:dihydrofolate reductase
MTCELEGKSKLATASRSSLGRDRFADLKEQRSVVGGEFRAAVGSYPVRAGVSEREARMGKVVVNEFMSLDGVVQAPGGEDEDTSGAFEHGGWSMRYMDEVAMQSVLGGITEAGGFLLGRRTYEIFAGYWPNAPEEEQVIAEPMNTKRKYVVSTTLTEPLEWQNSTLLQGAVAEAVTALKQENEGDLHVIGSSQLVQTLIAQNLVDELRLMIDPLTLGGGKRIFPDDGALRALQLADSEATTTGAILARYVPAKG